MLRTATHANKFYAWVVDAIYENSSIKDILGYDLLGEQEMIVPGCNNLEQLKQYVEGLKAEKQSEDKNKSKNNPIFTITKCHDNKQLPYFKNEGSKFSIFFNKNPTINTTVVLEKEKKLTYSPTLSD